MNLSDFLSYFDIEYDEFESFVDYKEFIMTNPPRNFEGFNTEQKKAFFERLKTDYNSNISSDEKKLREIKSIFNNSGKSFSNTKSKSFKSAINKHVIGEKLNKTELKNWKSMVFTRAAQIRKDTDLTKSQANKLAWKEFE